MRYTRYDLKHKKSSSMPFVICLTLVLFLSFLIGTFIFKTFIKVSGTSQNAKIVSKENDKKSEGMANFFIIQCSANSKKENADKVLNDLNNIGNPFEVKDKGLYKVIYAACSEKDYDAYEKNVKSNKFDFNKFNISFSKSDLGGDELYDMISAYLEIINKFNDKNVKSVQVSSLKKWCASLQNVNQDYKNYKVIEEIKKHIASLSSDINRDNINENEIFIYNELMKIK